ncbi:hypothetical protein TrRE_jg312, partial [Triparma retinervis]
HQALPASSIGMGAFPLSVSQNSACPPLDGPLMQDLQRRFWPHNGRGDTSPGPPLILYRYFCTMPPVVLTHFHAIFYARVVAWFDEMKCSGVISQDSTLTYNIQTITSSLRWGRSLNLREVEVATSNFTTSAMLPWHQDHIKSGFYVFWRQSRLVCEFRTLSKMGGHVSVAAASTGKKNINCGTQKITWTAAALTEHDKGTGVCGGAGTLGPGTNNLASACFSVHSGEYYGPESAADNFVASIDHCVEIKGVEKERIRGVMGSISAALSLAASDLTSEENMENLEEKLGEKQTQMVKEELRVWDVKKSAEGQSRFDTLKSG